MRVTDQMRYNDFVPRYQDLLRRQIDVQRQVSGGIKILRASDAPAAAGRSNILNQNIAQLDQNLKNIDNATAFGSATEVAIQNSINAMQRVRELAIQAGDGTLTPAARADIGEEVEALLRTVVGLGQQTYQGRTLLSGTQTDTPAYSTTTNAQGQITAVTYDGNQESMKVEIAPGRTTNYNLFGFSDGTNSNFGVFQDTTAGVDVFSTMINLRGFLETNNVANITAQSVGEVDKALEHLAKGMAKLGGIQTRMQETTFVNEDHRESLQESLQTQQETDVAEAAIEFSSLETAYQAALSMGARLMQLSLVNFVQ